MIQEIKHITRYMVFALLIVLVSCQNDYSDIPALKQAEAIMETKPDSALKVLEQIQTPTNLSDNQYAVYCLLLTQARDKNYIYHTSDTTIKNATDYFDKHSDIHRSSLAHFYSGRVYSDMQNALQAQTHYLKALQLSEKLHNNSLLIKVCNSLGTLYLYQDIFEKALPLYQRTLTYLEHTNDSTNISFAYRNIARVYTETQNPDSAIHYYQQSIQYSTPQSVSSILNDLGNLYLKEKDYNEAYQSIRKAIESVANPNLLPSLYLTMGEYYTRTERYDSASLYLNKSMESPSYYTQAGALYYLGQIEKRQRNFEIYAKYTEQYEELRDSIEKDSHFENIRRVQGMFDYQKLVEDSSKFEKEASQRMINMYQIVIFFTAVFIISCVIFKREQQKRKTLLELKEGLYKQSQQYIEDNKNKILQLQEELSSGKEKISEAKRQLFEARKQILEMENRQVILKQGTMHLLEEDFKTSDLYLKVNKTKNRLTDSEWYELQQLIDATYSDFTQRLIKLYPRISEEELRVCYLVKMNIPVKVIALLMNITSSGISQCRKRLYKKLTEEPENSEKFDSFIADF